MNIPDSIAKGNLGHSLSLYQGHLDKNSPPWKGNLCSIPSFYSGWLYTSLVAGGKVIKLSNLCGLYKLGKDFQDLREGLTEKDTRSTIIARCIKVKENMESILFDKIIPLVAVKKWAKDIFDYIENNVTGIEGQHSRASIKWHEPLKIDFIWELKNYIERYEAALSEELSQVPAYVVTKKGNLSTESLVEGASNGYCKRTIDLIDEFIRFEIDEAGRCLAFGLFTACGFHILRSVEVAIKGYIVAAKGSLPKNRNWGEYIVQLEDIGASSNLIDNIIILKTKRNPLMHPQDKLEEEEGISLFNICNSAMDELIKDVINKGLDDKFEKALAMLPSA
jgi:hypothetical protein